MKTASIIILSIFCFNFFSIKAQNFFAENSSDSHASIETSPYAKNNNAKFTNKVIENSEELSFTDFKKEFLDEYFSQFPSFALFMGLHKYDAILEISDIKTQSAQNSFADVYLKKLEKIQFSELSDLDKIDYELIKNELHRILWNNNELNEWQWNPASYNVGDQFAMILASKNTSLENCLRNLGKKATFVPKYYKSAKENIKNPVEVLQNLAISQNKGSLETFEKSIPDSIKVSKLSKKEKQSILKNITLAKSAINDYISWLENYKPTERKDFRLGEKLYQQKFEYEIQSGFTANELYDLALKRKTFIHSEMAKLSKQLCPKYFGNQTMPNSDIELIKKVIDTLSSQHIKASEFQTAIEKQIPDLVKFINDKNLLYLDPSKPLIVRKEPAYMAGVAGASISNPGPFEPNENTYYNVGSLEGWSQEDVESYLREYNNYMLQILNIHEAIPGHYTQLVYANKSPSMIKSVFGNGSMVEGWAVYGEQMMLENGYGNNSPEMWLIWYKWNLRSVCNTILDYSVHTKDMSKEKALDLLMNEAFQEKQEAEGKWKRLTLTSVQLTSYYNGYQEIINLREKLQKRDGKNFNLKAFNEQFLSYGSSPVKFISQIMLK